MSRIGSKVKQVTQQHARHVAHASRAAQMKAAKGVTDSFETVRTLHDPGTKKPGRETRELVEWRGLRSADAQQFVGVEGRLFAQRSSTAGSLGGDAFIGARETSLESGAHGDRRTQILLGGEAHAAVFGGAVNGARAGATAGLQLEETTTRQDGDVKTEQTLHLLYGAAAEAQVQVGTVTGGKLDLFVGARGGQDQRGALTNPDGSERAGLGLRGRALVGVGVMLDGEAGHDVESGQTRVSVGAGAALGLGLYGGGEVTIGGNGGK